MQKSFQPSRLLNPHIAALESYTPIQPFEVLSQRLGLPAERIVKLDANENPYGPVPGVVEALAEYSYYHIYPDPQQSELRAALSGYVSGQAKVPAENILTTHGADEMLDYLCRLFLQPGDAILNTPPTFGMYSFDAKLQGASVVDVWRDREFCVDVDGIVGQVAGGRSQVASPEMTSPQPATRHSPLPKLLFLTSPNNPSGTWLPDADLRRLLELPLMLVLDEAYVDFADEPSRADWVLARENLVVLRTFSKAAGIAGLRLGYAICPQWLMPHLWKFKQPYNVNVAASVAGLASLRRADHIRDTVERIKRERVRLFDALREIPFLRPHPSQANFILCDVVGRSGAEVKGALERHGVLVRYYSKPRLENCIRISVGRPEQTDRLLSVLREV